MISAYTLSALIALFLTILSEAVVLYVLGSRSRELQKHLFFINLFTNSLLSLSIAVYGLTFQDILLAEVLIVAVEAGLIFLLFNFSLRKSLLTAVVLNGTSLLLGIVVFSMHNPGYRILLLCQMSGDQVTCVKNKVLTTAENTPNQTKVILDTVFEQWLYFLPNADRRELSDTVHEVGAVLAQAQPLSSALLNCSTYWYAGCIHGAVMEAAHSGATSIGDIRFVCSDIAPSFEYSLEYAQHDVIAQCMHGIGHALWAERSDATLTEVLARCDEYGKSLACESGVLMEYSKGGMHHGTIGSVPLPCDELDESLQETCVAAEASYQFYYPGSGVADVEGFCGRYEGELRKVCELAGMSRVGMGGGE